MLKIFAELDLSAKGRPSSKRRNTVQKEGKGLKKLNDSLGWIYSVKGLSQTVELTKAKKMNSYRLWKSYQSDQSNLQEAWKALSDDEKLVRVLTVNIHVAYIHARESL